MENLSGQVINLLNDIIKNKILEVDKYRDIDWKEIFKRSEKYNVLPIVYEGIKNTELTNKIDKSVIDELKDKSIFIEKQNEICMKNYINILNKLKDLKVKVIVVGSLISKEFYSISKTRPINSLDILINDEDLNIIDKTLKSLGYLNLSKEENKNEIIFLNKNMVIRVRWTLFNNFFFSEQKLSFEDELLKKIRQIDIENEKILTTSLDDLLITLCLDMSDQFYNNKLEFIELLDLLLLVEKYSSIIDWKTFLYKSKQCGIYRFVIALFMVEERLFNMNIPDLIDKQEKLEDKYIRMLINELMNDYSDNNIKDNRGKKSAVFNNISKFKDIFEKLIPNKGVSNREELLRELGL